MLGQLWLRVVLPVQARVCRAQGIVGGGVPTCAQGRAETLRQHQDLQLLPPVLEPAGWWLGRQVCRRVGRTERRGGEDVSRVGRWWWW